MGSTPLQAPVRRIGSIKTGACEIRPDERVLRPVNMRLAVSLTVCVGLLVGLASAGQKRVHIFLRKPWRRATEPGLRVPDEYRCYNIGAGECCSNLFRYTEVRVVGLDLDQLLLTYIRGYEPSEFPMNPPPDNRHWILDFPVNEMRLGCLEDEYFRGDLRRVRTGVVIGVKWWPVDVDQLAAKKRPSSPTRMRPKQGTKAMDDGSLHTNGVNSLTRMGDYGRAVFLNDFCSGSMPRKRDGDRNRTCTIRLGRQGAEAVAPSEAPEPPEAP